VASSPRIDADVIAKGRAIHAVLPAPRIEGCVGLSERRGIDNDHEVGLIHLPIVPH
jgi:hypothetical protein